MFNLIMSKRMSKKLIYTVNHINNCVDKMQTIFIQSSFSHCKYKLLGGLHQKKYYTQDIAVDKSSPSLYSKHGSNVQFDMIRKFLEEEKTTPSVERWSELREEVLSLKGTYLYCRSFLKLDISVIIVKAPR